jgi:hypothetical protein
MLPGQRSNIVGAAGRFLTCLLLLTSRVNAEPVAEPEHRRSPEPVQATAQPLPEYLRTIMDAPDLITSIGFAATENQLGLCVNKASHEGAAIAKELHYVYDHGTPAGKLLAAKLIAGFDLTSARQLLRKLSEDQTEVKYREGCIVQRARISVLAKKAEPAQVKTEDQRH